MLSILSLLLSLQFATADNVPIITLPPTQPQAVYTVQQVDNDAQDWALPSLNVPKAWEKTEGEGAIVAVIDTGHAINHRDLKDAVIYSQDFTPGNNVNDGNGHGTWCITAIGARRNGWGMVGIAPKCKLISLKALDDGGSGAVTWIANAIRVAADKGAHVISLSLGGSNDQYIPPAVEYAISKGCIVVAAAGNSGPGENTTGFPGALPNVICVAAHDKTNQPARFSSRGPNVITIAPGVATRAGYPGPGDGLFADLSGTSMSTPRVAGMLALAHSAGSLGPVDSGRQARAMALLQTVCERPTGPRRTVDGFGRPDAGKIVGVAPPAPVDPQPVPTPGKVKIEISLADLTEPALRRIAVLAGEGKQAEIVFKW